MAPSPPTSEKSRSRRRPGAPDKGAQVLDAAVQEFLANGFDKTSMDAVATRAGVSKTTVYAHFSDKFALFKAVVDRSSRSLAVQMDETRLRVEEHPRDRIAALLLTVLEATTAPEFLAFLRVMVSESARRPDLTYATDPGEMVDVVGLIASTLEEEAEQNGYELSDSRMFATLLLRIAVSSPQLDSLLFSQFRPDRALLDAHAHWITMIFLQGIRPREGDDRKVTPFVEGYGYPWLPGTPGGL